MGRIAELGDDPLVNVGNQPPPDLVENALLQHRRDLVPVRREFAEMRHRRQRIKGRTPRRRHRRIGDRRMVEIQREILAQHPGIVNVGQQALITRPEQDHVVRNPRPRPLHPEMHDEQRGRKALAFQPVRRPLRTARPGEQVAIAVHQIGVARDHIRLEPRAARRHHTGRPLAQRFDLRHRIAKLQHPAQPFELAHHARDQPVGPALREPNPAIALELVDQRIDGTRRHRIAADQQGVERQRLAQLLVLHEGRNHRIDAAPRLIFGQRRCRLHHRGKVEKRDMAELFIALAINARRIVEKPAIPVDIGGIEPRDLAHQDIVVIGVIEIGAVGPVEPVKGIDGRQRHIIGQPVPGQRPQFLQRIGRGDDGGSGIEGETVALPIISAPARLVAAFDDRRRHARALQPDGERQPAEPGADLHRALHAVFSRVSPRIAAIARPIGTGGLPVNSRAWSNRLV